MTRSFPTSQVELSVVACGVRRAATSDDAVRGPSSVVARLPALLLDEIPRLRRPV